MTEEQTFVCSTGVELTLRPPDSALMYQVASQFMKENPRPKPPMVYMEDKGREEPNESDPDYVAAVIRHDGDVTVSLLEAFVIMGVADVKEIPFGIMRVHSEDYKELMQALGFDIPANEKKAQAQWILRIAAPTRKDKTDLAQRLTRMAGVAEEDVQSMMEQQFPGDSEQPANSTVSSQRAS